MKVARVSLLVPDDIAIVSRAATVGMLAAPNLHSLQFSSRKCIHMLHCRHRKCSQAIQGCPGLSVPSLSFFQETNVSSVVCQIAESCCPNKQNGVYFLLLVCAYVPRYTDVCLVSPPKSSHRCHSVSMHRAHPPPCLTSVACPMWWAFTLFLTFYFCKCNYNECTYCSWYRTDTKR